MEPATVTPARPKSLSSAAVAVVERVPLGLPEQPERRVWQCEARMSVAAFGEHRAEPEHECRPVHLQNDARQKHGEQIGHDGLDHMSMFDGDGMVDRKRVMLHNEKSNSGRTG